MCYRLCIINIYLDAVEIEDVGISLYCKLLLKLKTY